MGSRDDHKPEKPVGEPEIGGILRSGPGQELRHRATGRIGTEQALRFLTANVQLVGERIVRCDQVDEVALQALRNQDRWHAPYLVVRFPVGRFALFFFQTRRGSRNSTERVTG